MNATPVVSASPRDVWLTRLYYIFISGMGFVAPFLNLFYTRIGMSGVEVGTVGSLSAVITLLVAPIWASRAEQVRNPRLLLQIGLVLGAFGTLLLSQQTTAIGVLLVVAFNALIGSGNAPLSDGLAVAVTHGRRAGFGSIRIFGSIGWIIFVPIGGWLAEQVSLVGNFIGYALTLFTCAVIAGNINRQHFGTRSAKRAKLSEAIIGLRRNLPMLGFALTLIIIGFANNGILQFEYVFLDTLGATESIIGFVSILGAIVEVPMMLWADRLLNRFKPYVLLLIGLFMNAGVRLLVFIVPSVEMIVVERLIGGVAFSFWVVASISFITQNTQPNETRTMLALFNVSLASLIGIVASPIMGALYDTVGMRPLYIVATIGYIVGAVALLIIVRRASVASERAH